MSKKSDKNLEYAPKPVSTSTQPDGAKQVRYSNGTVRKDAPKGK
jgi:hypothetical protein